MACADKAHKVDGDGGARACSRTTTQNVTMCQRMRQPVERTRSKTPRKGLTDFSFSPCPFGPEIIYPERVNLILAVMDSTL